MKRNALNNGKRQRRKQIATEKQPVVVELFAARRLSVTDYYSPGTGLTARINTRHGTDLSLIP